MNKIFLFCAVAMAALCTSCSTYVRTARVAPVLSNVAAISMADLDVSNQKITYTYSTTASIRNGGVNNCINAAISEALEKNGGGDVLVETQSALIQKGSGKLKTITVTGYPAKYRNFRPVDDETLKAVIISGDVLRQEKDKNTIKRTKLK